MSQSIENLIAAARTDAALQQKLRNAANAQQVVDIAAAREMSVTTGEVEQLFDSLQNRPLTEDELMGVAGGNPGNDSITSMMGCTGG